MRSFWDDREAASFQHDPLQMRVYSSRLLGKEPALVLHGGGNTSVKTKLKDFFGQSHDVLYIKGSGWDLATIEAAGFAPVKMPVLLKMAQLKDLSDDDMVIQQRLAMLNPLAPNPSVEAILHAIIPYTYVDHSHADVIAALTNTPNGRKHMTAIFGNRLLIVDYVMPGFALAKKVFEMTKDLDWSLYDGIVLLNHGLFTFASTAKASYEQHIRLVTKAENYIKSKKISLANKRATDVDLLQLAALRQEVSKARQQAVIALLDNTPQAVGFSAIAQVEAISSRGTLTPDHVIRIKPKPVVIKGDIAKSVSQFVKEYQDYVRKNLRPGIKPLDASPRWAIIPNQGVVSFGVSIKDAQIVADIVEHTQTAMQWSQALGGWKPVGHKDLFDVEYWSLEQAKLSASGKQPLLQGKIALVTGAASGIGLACVNKLLALGACVVGLDINPHVEALLNKPNAIGIPCDVTDDEELKVAVSTTVRAFGGLDILVSNAGIFPPSATLAQMDAADWDKSLRINLTSHQRLLARSVDYLALGINPAVVIVASKNVPAPGPGAGAYSVAKAGLTQMARIAALELGDKGIRVNVIHPNQVFDTAIWTEDVLKRRAKHYKLTVEEYKTNNILHTAITSNDVAELVLSLVSPAFSKTTGAQIPIDGGNDRVI